MQIRPLDSRDALQLEAFLRARRESSMFLRANAKRGGLHPAACTDVFVAAFEAGEITGVAAQGASGMLLIQAPVAAVADLTRACVSISQRPVTGLAGPAPQVEQARLALALRTEDASYHRDEWLYGLDLCDLRVPSALSSGLVGARAPLPGERDTLCAWRLAYDLESLGSSDSEQTRQRSAHFLDQQIADGNAWVAVESGAPVSLSAFNAALPDIVQLGGIYTPPELRGRGFAKVAVAAALLAARDRGAERAVLFTSNPSAVRTYEALGFRRTGSYAIALYR
ncbi:MAG TPA: GNAT family N-acetyltransferase [Polyangiaceae bacterium]|nr:GNAT family N-acetyltransferase [Polyangiaceae bacterium]